MPAPLPDAIPFVALPSFVRAAGLCGIDLPRLLGQIGLRPDAIHPGVSPVSVSDVAHLVHLCTDEARARGSAHHFPLMLGDSFRFEYLSDLEIGMSTSPTLRSSLRVFDWLRPFLNRQMRTELLESPHVSQLVLHVPTDTHPPQWQGYFAETFFAGMSACGRGIIADPEPVHELWLVHQPKTDPAVYEAFFQVPVRFGKPVNAAVFPTRLLNQPLRGSFPALSRQAEQRVEARLSELAPTTHIVQQLEQAFDECPGLLGLGMEVMAERLGLSKRTLQRRLQEADQNYLEVQSGVRVRMAERLLREGRLSIEEIAERLGFKDRRSFTQLFTRHSGQSPSRFQRALAS